MAIFPLRSSPDHVAPALGFYDYRSSSKTVYPALPFQGRADWNETPVAPGLRERPD
jgi:hypothetical protein